MIGLLQERREAIVALCLRHGVRRLEVFGSALRAGAFDPAHSDVDVLVDFGDKASSETFLDFKESVEALLQTPVDLVERQAVEASRNPIRKRRILSEATTLYAA